jgi:hypothetical protein
VEYRQATADEIPLLAAFTWQMTAENEAVTQAAEEFTPHFLEWARSVRSTHIPFGLGSVTVSSGRRAVPLYQRIGFTGVPPYLRAFPP